MTTSPKAQAEAMAAELRERMWFFDNHQADAGEKLISTALEKLLTENERLKEYIHTVEGEKKIAVDCGHDLHDQLTATEAKLSRGTTSGWLKHAPGCAEFIPLYGCRCGLTDFLSTLTAAKKEEAK